MAYLHFCVPILLFQSVLSNAQSEVFLESASEVVHSRFREVWRQINVARTERVRLSSLKHSQYQPSHVLAFLFHTHRTKHSDASGSALE